jgi:hypothetical protein
MPCYCGDLRCFSCGPAQGNNRCEICGKWDDDGGCDNPQACEAAADEMYARLAKDEAEASRAAEEYFRDTVRDLESRHGAGDEHCPHGNRWESCNDCMVASDLAYDAARERR